MKGWPWLLDEANLVCQYRKNTQNSAKLSNNERNIEKVMEIFQKRRNILATTSLYPLQLLNYDRDAATDPSLQNNADPSPFSLPGWKKVDKQFDYSNNLQDFSEYNLLFCYRMRRIR